MDPEFMVHLNFLPLQHLEASWKGGLYFSSSDPLGQPSSAGKLGTQHLPSSPHATFGPPCVRPHHFFFKPTNLRKPPWHVDPISSSQVLVVRSHTKPSAQQCICCCSSAGFFAHSSEHVFPLVSAEVFALDWDASVKSARKEETTSRSTRTIPKRIIWHTKSGQRRDMAG